MGIKNTARPPVSHEQARVLELMVTSTDPAQVKVGLQRACEFLESGQSFLDYAFLHLGAAASLISNDVKVRRWAYKLVALLADPRHLEQVELALLGSERDPENRSWASAAFSAIASEK